MIEPTVTIPSVPQGDVTLDGVPDGVGRQRRHGRSRSTLGLMVHLIAMVST